MQGAAATVICVTHPSLLDWLTVAVGAVGAAANVLGLLRNRRASPPVALASSPMADVPQLRDSIRKRLNELEDEAHHLRGALTALETPPDNQRTARGAAGPRAASGSVRARLLIELDDGVARTSGELAGRTGLRRTTVASTLPRLVAEGALIKAPRGYRRAP